MSDGVDSPKDIVEDAKNKGLSFVAITDHDCLLGIDEALETGRKIGQKVITGIEFDIEYKSTVHMLGLNFDPENKALIELVEAADKRRLVRNRAIFEKLRNAGYDIEKLIVKEQGSVTRLHIANALVEGGFAKSRAEAFRDFMDEGAAGYVYSKKTDMETAIKTVHAAGGICVLAHPCKLRCDARELIAKMADMGLDGIEVFYPTATSGQKVEFLSLARQYGLIVTSGSDYHGKNRDCVLGDGFEKSDALKDIYKMFGGR